MKTTITKKEFLALTDIFAMVDHEMKIISTLSNAAQAITGEEDVYGHTEDAVWNTDSRSVKKLLKKLGIRVEK